MRKVKYAHKELFYFVQQQHLVLVNVCFEKEAKEVGYRKLWGGDVDNKDCSSLGGSCRGLKDGIAFLKPDGSTATYTGTKPIASV